METPRTRLPLGLCALAALIAASAAQSAAPASRSLELESRLFREAAQVDVNGATRRSLSNVSTVRSGDKLLFVIRYRNTGTAPVTGTAIVSELPPRVSIDPSQNSRIEVSLDGGHRWDRPGATFLTTTDGKLRPASGRAPTHIRVRLDRPVAPGASGQEIFRATIL